MKYIPILFSTPMVQAILEGRKTMTRRVVKNDHVLYCLDVNKFIPSYFNYDNGFCPYGFIGDVLWVREKFREWCPDEEGGAYHPVLEYAADNHEPKLQCDGDGFQMFNKNGTEKYISWKPSLFMPKASCRIFLEVTDVRIERLHTISEDDIYAEGITNNKFPFKEWERLWVKINGGESWNLNPWVWVITFKQIEKPESFFLT